MLSLTNGMASRILFLGTGGDAFVVGKQYRASGGIVLKIDNNQFHINPGPGTIVMAKMMGLNLRENTAVFISKNDLFSANDVNAIISAMTHDGLDKRGVLVCPGSVVQNSFLTPFYKNCLEKTIPIDNTKKIGVNNIDIEIVKLSNSYGFKFFSGRFVLGYIPDTRYSSEIGEYYQNSDILIINVLDPRNYRRDEHLNSEDVEKIFRTAKPQLSIITGFGIKMLQSQPMYEAREIQKSTGVQVIAAKDGMTINPISFATTVRQKSLKGF